MLLKPCDIVTVRGEGWLSRQILAATACPGEPPSEVSHVGVVVEAGTLSTAVLQEAVWKVRRTTIADAYGPGVDGQSGIAIFRPLTLGDDERAAILARAAATAGRMYGFGKIALQLLDSLAGRVAGREVYAFRHLGLSPWPICSGNLADCFMAAGLGFGVEAGRATPDDVWDWCVAHPRHYELIRPLTPITAADLEAEG
jgi:hypothetical protein